MLRLAVLHAVQIVDGLPALLTQLQAIDGVTAIDPPAS
jgi:hypothetical protein